MSGWSYHNPVRLHAGSGSLVQLPQWVTPGNWLLVTSAGFTSRGVAQDIKRLLPGINLYIYDQVTPNPELDDLEKIIQCYRHQNVQGVLALGGGSVLDAAKVLSVAISSDVDKPLVQALRQGRTYTWNRKIPLIVIPTTSGTGSEVTPFATVWDGTQHKKYSVAGEAVFPDRAIVDPQLTLGLPKKETLYTGLDAVSHALESIWNVNRTPISSSFALQALELAVNALPHVLASPVNLKARANMQSASLLAGMAISQTRTAIAHSISYPLTSHHGVPHGLACSFTLPSLINHYININPGCAEKSLLLQVQRMVNKFELHTHLERYVNRDGINSLTAEMHHPERAGNYAGIISDEIIEEVIFSSTGADKF